MKKRVFIAICASEHLKKKILEFKDKNRGLPVRWIRNDSLHITIIAPMELSDNELVEMIEKLKRIEGEFGPMEIEFDKICLGPDLRRPRLIWAKGKENFRLESLRNKIIKILGLEKGRRPYFVHLTLARFKPKDCSSFKIKDLGEEIDWMETAKSFFIIESKYLPEGAEYANLAEIKL